jgi:hypothetical protein
LTGLWGTVILVTGRRAAAGAVVFEAASEHAFAVVEGLAALGGFSITTVVAA